MLAEHLICSGILCSTLRTIPKNYTCISHLTLNYLAALNGINGASYFFLFILMHFWFLIWFWFHNFSYNTLWHIIALGHQIALLISTKTLTIWLYRFIVTVQIPLSYEFMCCWILVSISLLCLTPLFLCHQLDSVPFFADGCSIPRVWDLDIQ